jgi:hypothetical protein
VNILLVLLALQGSGWTVHPPEPTVGDTITLVRRVTAEPTATVRLEALTSTDYIQPLMAPRWSYAEGAVTIVYRVAAFASGDQPVMLPALDIVYPDGRVVTVPEATVVVNVASVLPDVPPSRLRPRASMGPIARQPQRIAPAIVVPGIVAIVMILVTLWHRRRAPRPAVPEVLDAEVHAPLDEWIAAGESRAVATVVALKLRRMIADMVSDADAQSDADADGATMLQGDRSAEAAALISAMRALERARFSPAAPADIHEVIDEAERAVRAFEVARTEVV